MKPFTAVFLADMQIGMYTTFSGKTDAEIAAYAARDMVVRKVPFVAGIDWDVAQYEKAVGVVNALRPDLVLVGGDMSEVPFLDEQLDAFERVTSSIDRDIAVRWAPGNHDIAFDWTIPTAASIAAYRDRFGADYFVHDQGPLRFVVLNTTVADHPELVPGEWADQLAFLDEVLADPGDRTIVAVGHHPLFLERPDEDESYWNLPQPQRAALYERLRRAGVPLMLAAHWHRNNIAVADGFEMVASGPVGYPLGDDPSGLRVVEFDGTGLRHHYEALS